MTPTQAKAVDLIDAIQAVHAKIDAFYRGADSSSVLSEPATSGALERLAVHWGRPLPPSYRAVLELHDGITELWLGGELLSVEKLVEESEEFDAFEDVAPNAWHWIVILGPNSDVVALDFNSVGEDGEPEVVEFFLDGYQKRWPNFLAFLEGYLAHMRSELAKLVADRANLKDD